MGACPGKQVPPPPPPPDPCAKADVYESPRCGANLPEIRKKCKQVPKEPRPAVPPLAGDLEPCPGGLFPPCPEGTDANYLIKERTRPLFAAKPRGIRDFLAQERAKDEKNESWRDIVEDIVSLTDETCPPPPRLKAYDQEQCFLPPHGPEPNPLYSWKRKCQETVDSFVAPDVVAFPKNFGGPGGDACMGPTPTEKLDSDQIWKDACRTRNDLMSKRNLLIARYNTVAEEVETLIEESVELRKHLMMRRCSNMNEILGPEKHEQHIADAVQMARDAVAFQEWEIRQLDELLESLTTMELDSRKRSQKMHDNYDVLRGAMPGIIERIRKCRDTKREFMNDLRKLIGEMASLLDACLRRPIYHWRLLRQVLKPTVAFFQKAMEDFSCAGISSCPPYLKTFLEQSGFSYASDADAMEKFAQDSTLLTQIHDMDMVFELLTNIAKQTTDEALTAIQQTDRKEVYRPWNAMVKEAAKEDCEALMIKNF